MHAFPAQENNSINLLPQSVPLVARVNRFAKGILVFALVIESFLLGNTLYFKVGVDLGTITLINTNRPQVAGAQAPPVVIPVVSGLLEDELGPDISSNTIFEADLLNDFDADDAGILTLVSAPVFEGSASAELQGTSEDEVPFAIQSKKDFVRVESNKRYKISVQYKGTLQSKGDLKILVTLLDANGVVVKEHSSFYPLSNSTWSEASTIINTEGDTLWLSLDFAVDPKETVWLDALSVREIKRELLPN